MVVWTCLKSQAGCANHLPRYLPSNPLATPNKPEQSLSMVESF